MIPIVSLQQRLVHTVYIHCTIDIAVCSHVHTVLMNMSITSLIYFHPGSSKNKQSLTYIEEDSGDAITSSVITEGILVDSGKVIVRLILSSYPIVHHLYNINSLAPQEQNYN